jgi:hypothetical protein
LGCAQSGLILSFGAWVSQIIQALLYRMIDGRVAPSAALSLSKCARRGAYRDHLVSKNLSFSG